VNEWRVRKAATGTRRWVVYQARTLQRRYVIADDEELFVWDTRWIPRMTFPPGSADAAVKAADELARAQAHLELHA
jgi:hypothetical protein